LTLQDHYSKWTEAFPIRRHTASVVARVLFDQVFSRFGCPIRLHSDQGPEFESVLFHELCVLMQIHKIRTSPYFPQGNGMIERWHRCLNSMLGKMVAANQRDWSDHIPTVLAAYRATVHDSTKLTPNRVFLRREVRLPIDLVLGSTPDDIMKKPSISEYVDAISDRLHVDGVLVRSNLGRTANIMKTRYDTKVKSAFPLKVGDKVWYYCPRRYVKLSPKWQNMYTGPFVVIALLDPCNVVIGRTKRSAVKVVHRDKLKPVIASTPEESNVPVDAPAFYPVTTNDELIHDLNNTSLDLSASIPALPPIERDTVIVPRRPTRQVKRPARFAKYVMSINCKYPCMFQRTMKAKRFPCRRQQYRCDQCEVTLSRIDSYRRHLSSKEHLARTTSTTIVPKEEPDSSDVSSTNTPAGETNVEAVVIDSTTDDDVEPVRETSENYDRKNRRWCYRCRLPIAPSSYHQHVNSRKHLNNSPRRRRQRLGQMLGEVDQLVVNFQAARSVALTVRDLLRRGETCNIKRVTDLMVREVGAIRREPMQLLATGILSGVHSCLEETFLRPSTPVVDRAPAVVGAIYCRTPSPAVEIDIRRKIHSGVF